MTKVLVLCKSDPQSDPRPNRMIHYLKDHYDVTVLGLNKIRMEGVESFAMRDVSIQPSLQSGIRNALSRSGLLFYHLRLRRMARALWARLRVPITIDCAGDLTTKFRERDFDLIVSHDIFMLPFAFSVRNRARVLLDAREYYPLHYEDRPRWRVFGQPVEEYLCAQYLLRCDKVMTVSQGIAEEYARVYKVTPEVIPSLPESYSLSPRPCQKDRIRIIHHGIVSMSRRPDLMITVMDYVGSRFSLDLMLMPERSAYWNRLCRMVAKRKNVRIIPPVPMKEIVPFTNQYDIGLLLCGPTTLNIRYGLGNKFFEFIQARLALAIGPLIEMKRIVEKYDCGIVSHDFQPRSMAEALNKLTVEKIMYYKEQSDKASLELNAEANSGRIRKIVESLVEN